MHVHTHYVKTEAFYVGTIVEWKQKVSAALYSNVRWTFFIYLLPGEKEQVNMWLVQILVGTTRLCVAVHEILTILRTVMLKHAGTKGSKINDTGFQCWSMQAILRDDEAE